MHGRRCMFASSFFAVCDISDCYCSLQVLRQKNKDFDAFQRSQYKTNMSMEADWQTTRPTIRERAKFMLNNDRISDVKFVVRKSDDESESKRVIPAHKFILSIGSPVFEAMFYGELAETKDTIELPDCDHESLLELFRYMYSDEVNLSGSNVMEVLYLAKKYIVPPLADKCTEYLQEKLDPSNVFSVLPFAQKYEHKTLVDRCWKVIDEQTEAAVKSGGFETIEGFLLETVVTRDTLAIKEVALFQAVDRWATKQCEQQGLTADGQVKRRILGEQMIKSIRFPVMTVEEFASVVVDTNILTPNETIGLFQFFTIHTSPVGFLKTQRRLQLACFRCGRFQSLSPWRGSFNNERKNMLGFSVNENITLHGIRLFGEENSRYTVKLEVKDSSDNTAVVSQSGTYLTDRLQGERFCCYGFQVSFVSAAYIKKNAAYRIEALIDGPPHRYGYHGLETVEKSGVTFSFLDIQNSPTSPASGQFFDFQFSV